MNLQELLESLSPEDRQIVLEHFIKSLQGGESNEPIVFRKTLKLSTLSSEEEMKKQVSNTLNIPIDKLDRFNFLEGIDKINSNFKKVDELTAPYKEYLTTLNSKADKFEELIDIGKFLISLNTPCSIDIPEKSLPYPDFIVKRADKTIGIEHTRILNTGSQIFIKNIRQILKTAEQIVKSINPNLTQVVNLSFNYQIEAVNNKSLSNPSLTKSEKDSIAQLVSSFVYAHLENRNATKPDFIDKIQFSTDSVHPISINLIENYIGKTEIESLLSGRLASKEGKHSNYSTISSFDELWLVIIINGVTVASSYIFDSATLKKDIESKFNKVFLFDTFSSDATVIFDSTTKGL